MPRTTYTQDERDFAARTIQRGQATVENVAASHGVQVPVVRRWVRDLEVREGTRVRQVRGSRIPTVRSEWFDRTFGVEFEFVGNRAAVVNAMQAVGLPCELQGYNHQDSDHLWKVVTDASVYGGGELVSPRLTGEDGREQVRKAAEALRNAGARVSTSCGLHVHHDARDLTLSNIRAIAMMWANVQDVIDLVLASSRRAHMNSYCKTFTTDHAMQVANVANLNGLRHIDRYLSLNVQSYSRHQTLELRQHQGTLNAKKTLAWVALGQAIFEAAVEGRTIRTSSVEAMVSDLNLDTATRRYFVNRAAALNQGRSDFASPRIREAV